MGMKVRRYANLFLAIFLLVFIGCSKTESKFIGKWQNTTMQERVEFRKDKSGFFDVLGAPPVPFKWSVLKDERIKLDFIVMGTPKTLLGKLDKGLFILEGNQMEATYRKIDK
jgi:hypothetical protein